MQIMLQQLNVVVDSCDSTLVLKRKAEILSTIYGISIHQWHCNIVVDVMLNIRLLLIISRWIMVWNKVVICLEVVIYKHLEIWRHNYVIGCNEYLICTLSESTIPLQFLFKSTNHLWRYKRKCKWVFFSEHSVVYRRFNKHWKSKTYEMQIRQIVPNGETWT